MSCGSNNTITVSIALTASLQVSDSSKVTLSGLLSASGPSASSIPITYLTSQETFGSHGTWSRSAGTLELTLASNLERGTLHIFAFSLTNPSSSQTAASISIAASGTQAIAAQAMTADTMNATSETGTVAGDAAPLKVYPATFIVRTIGQRTPYPSAQNVLTVTLASTVLLRGAHDDMILLSGLKGSATPDNGALSISSPSTSIFSSTAAWDSEVGDSFGQGGFLGVELLNTSVVAPGVSIVFSFSLQNPSTPNSAQAVTATWTGITGFVAQTMNADTTSVLSLPGSTPGDAAPLKVDASAFVLKSIRQSTVFPWANNEIHVSIAANVVLYGDAKTVITISGILGSPTGQEAHFHNFPTSLPLTYSSNSSDVFGASALWSKETGQLRLQIREGASLPAGRVCGFSFQLRNPDTSNSESSSISIVSSSTSAAATLGMTSMDVFPFLLLNFSGSEAGDAIPLRVHPPAFVLASLRQSTTFPGLARLRLVST